MFFNVFLLFLFVIVIYLLLSLTFFILYKHLLFLISTASPHLPTFLNLISTCANIHFNYFILQIRTSTTVRTPPLIANDSCYRSYPFNLAGCLWFSSLFTTAIKVFFNVSLIRNLWRWIRISCSFTQENFSINVTGVQILIIFRICSRLKYGGFATSPTIRR